MGLPVELHTGPPAGAPHWASRWSSTLGLPVEVLMVLLVVQAAVRAEELLRQKGEQVVLVERVDTDTLSVSSFTLPSDEELS